MYKEQFIEWVNDGNVSKFDDGYSTQCSQYTNRFKKISQLYKYFLKEFIYI
jgi:hypothetical protein